MLTSKINWRKAFQLTDVHYPRTIDEKMGGELGLHAWMQKHCPQTFILFSMVSVSQIIARYILMPSRIIEIAYQLRYFNVF